MSTPKFPIKVVFHEDNDLWVLNSIDELGSNLEWFDSEDSDENASVFDSESRPVYLKVEKLEVKHFALKKS